jgi:hypothetical protein
MQYVETEQLCVKAAACRTSQNGDQCGYSWSSTLDVGFICKCVLPARRPVLFRKDSDPVHLLGNNICDMISVI